MRELRDRLDRLRELERAQAPALLATIVRVEGSSYRREGARLLVEPDGRLTGVLSGGCLERDIVALAVETLASGAPRLAVYDLTADEEAIWGSGTGCAGRVTLLLEPLDRERRQAEIDLLASLLEARRELRVATLYQFERPARESPQSSVGDRLVLTMAGLAAASARRPRAAGTTAGPAGAPPPVQSRRGSFFRAPHLTPARALLETLAPGEARAAALATGGGEASLLIESLLPPIHLLLIGAERDVPALARLGLELGWAVSVADARPSAAAAARFGAGVVYRGAAPRELGAEGVELSPRTAVLLATHRYLDDLAYLAELADAPLGYLGLLGPVRRRERILTDLDRLDPQLARRCRARLSGPAGLDLGGRAPEEVALSVVAEIQAAFRRRGAGRLSAKPGSGGA